jgi:hypothetical protein
LKLASYFFALAAGVYLAMAVELLRSGPTDVGLDYIAATCFCLGFTFKTHAGADR